jgi:hypothetical protein
MAFIVRDPVADPLQPADGVQDIIGDLSVSGVLTTASGIDIVGDLEVQGALIIDPDDDNDVQFRFETDPSGFPVMRWYNNLGTLDTLFGITTGNSFVMNRITGGDTTSFFGSATSPTATTSAFIFQALAQTPTATAPAFSIANALSTNVVDIYADGSIEMDGDLTISGVLTGGGSPFEIVTRNLAGTRTDPGFILDTTTAYGSAGNNLMELRQNGSKIVRFMKAEQSGFQNWGFNFRGPEDTFNNGFFGSTNQVFVQGVNGLSLVSWNSNINLTAGNGGVVSTAGHQGTWSVTERGHIFDTSVSTIGSGKHSSWRIAGTEVLTMNANLDFEKVSNTYSTPWQFVNNVGNLHLRSISSGQVLIQGGVLDTNGIRFLGSTTDEYATIGLDGITVWRDKTGATGATAGDTTVDSRSLILRGDFWNGSASQEDLWALTNVVTGTNPISRLSVTHSGVEHFSITHNIASSQASLDVTGAGTFNSAVGGGHTIAGNGFMSFNARRTNGDDAGQYLFEAGESGVSADMVQLIANGGRMSLVAREPDSATATAFLFNNNAFGTGEELVTDGAKLLSIQNDTNEILKLEHGLLNTNAGFGLALDPHGTGIPLVRMGTTHANPAVGDGFLSLHNQSGSIGLSFAVASGATINMPLGGNNVFLFQSAVGSTAATSSAFEFQATVHSAAATAPAWSLKDSAGTKVINMFADGSLVTAGGHTVSRTGSASDIVVTKSDHIIGITDTSVARLVTLPDVAAAGVDTGKEYIIKDESGNASGNNITISGQTGQLIDGANTAVISSDYGVVRVYAENVTASGWFTY